LVWKEAALFILYFVWVASVIVHSYTSHISVLYVSVGLLIYTYRVWCS
jgi:hypothetical protein